MTRFISRDNVVGHGAFGPEPARDPELGALLRDALSDAPMHDVDWDSLRARVNAAVLADANPWWGWAERWQRRVVPLALAAGLVGAALLWNADGPAPSVTTPAASDHLVAVLNGTPVADAASSYARTVTGTSSMPLAGRTDVISGETVAEPRE